MLRMTYQSILQMAKWYKMDHSKHIMQKKSMIIDIYPVTVIGYILRNHSIAVYLDTRLLDPDGPPLLPTKWYLNSA